MFTISEIRNPCNKDYELIEEFYKTYSTHLNHDDIEYTVNLLKNIKSNEVIAYTRRIFYLKFEEKVVGLLIISKDLIDPMIEFLAIDKAYRGFGGANELLQICFKILSTNKPVIHIPINKYMDFKEIIERYDWSSSTFYMKNDTRVFILNYF